LKLRVEIWIRAP